MNTMQRTSCPNGPTTPMVAEPRSSDTQRTSYANGPRTCLYDHVRRSRQTDGTAGSVKVPSELDFIAHPSFGAHDMEKKLFGEEAKHIEVVGWSSFPEVSEEAGARRQGRVALSGEEESLLFLRYNYARYRLSRLAQAQQRRLSNTRSQRMMVWYDRVQRTRADLVKANLALVLAMAKRTRIPHVEFGELISEGNMALLRSVEKFDVSRGFKFSTYACRSILKGFNRLATKTGRYHQRFPTEYDPDVERSDYDVRKYQIERQDTIESLREVLAGRRAHLSHLERTIVTERFALSADGKRRTLAEVGKIVGLTNERVRQIQNIALAKIRRVMVE